jgi:hypothetical protein
VVIFFRPSLTVSNSDGGSNSAFCLQCIYGLRMILRINSDYFPEQHCSIDLCYADSLCFVKATPVCYTFNILLLRAYFLKTWIELNWFRASSSDILWRWWTFEFLNRELIGQLNNYQLLRNTVGYVVMLHSVAQHGTQYRPMDVTLYRWIDTFPAKSVSHTFIWIRRYTWMWKFVKNCLLRQQFEELGLHTHSFLQKR